MEQDFESDRKYFKKEKNWKIIKRELLTDFDFEMYSKSRF